MTEIVVVLVAVVALAHFTHLLGSSPSSALAPTPISPGGTVPMLTPATSVPFVPPIGTAGAPISSAYAVTAPQTTVNTARGLATYITIGGKRYVSYNGGAPVPVGGGRPVTVPQTPTPVSPPYVSGGIPSGVGAGGNPLGGGLRPGLSLGSGTTSIPPIPPVTPLLVQ